MVGCGGWGGGEGRSSCSIIGLCIRTGTPEHQLSSRNDIALRSRQLIQCQIKSDSTKFRMMATKIGSPVVGLFRGVKKVAGDQWGKKKTFSK